MLLQMDSTSEMLQGYLQPWVHFVPINFELSDLVPKVRHTPPSLPFELTVSLVADQIFN